MRLFDHETTVARGVLNNSFISNLKDRMSTTSKYKYLSSTSRVVASALRECHEKNNFRNCNKKLYSVSSSWTEYFRLIDQRKKNIWNFKTLFWELLKNGCNFVHIFLNFPVSTSFPIYAPLQIIYTEMVRISYDRAVDWELWVNAKFIEIRSWQSSSHKSSSTRREKNCFSPLIMWTHKGEIHMLRIYSDRQERRHSTYIYRAINLRWCSRVVSASLSGVTNRAVDGQILLEYVWLIQNFTSTNEYCANVKHRISHRKR